MFDSAKNTGSSLLPVLSLGEPASMITFRLFFGEKWISHIFVQVVLDTL